MKQIPLTQGKFAIVDDDDYEWLSKHKWHYSGKYAIRSLYKLFGKQKHIFMHVEIMKTPNGMETDHIDRDKPDYGLDNRKENLRICTTSQNQHNQKIHIDNTSGYKGVSFHKSNKKWRAYIIIDGKQKFLGHFHTAKDAAIAYNKTASETFGEFARLNYIEK